MKTKPSICQSAAPMLVLAAAMCVATSAAAQDLYPSDVLNLIQPYDGAIQDHAASEDASILRSRTVFVNPHDLRNLPATPDAQFEIELFDDVQVWATFRTPDDFGPGEFTWTGDLAGESPGSFVISVVGDVMLADFRLPTGQTYQVRYLADGVHVVRQVGISGHCGLTPGYVLPPALAARVEEAAGRPKEGPGGLAAGDDGSTIDVLVAYTADVRQAEGGEDATIALINEAISDTNDRFDRSGMSKRVRLVGRYEVNYEETGDAGKDLKRLTDPDDGHMDRVHGERDYEAADLVALLVDRMGDNILGIGRRPASREQLVPGFGFTVTKRNAATEGTFAHELGHNLGCHHHPNDNGAGNDPVIYDYAFGHRSYPWRTTMAYDTEPGFFRIPHFSNPDVNYSSTPTGTSDRNNTRVIRNTAEAVAQYAESVTWVDFHGHAPFPNGSRFRPYWLLGEGLANVQSGHILRFKGGSTSQTIERLGKPMTLMVNDKPVTIGMD